ncbi:MAG: thiamine phosphate synthase [Kiloniellales bacterium]
MPGPARPAFDLTLYLVAGSDAVAGRDLVQVVEAALRGGVTLVQLREKQGPREAMIASARALKAMLDRHRVPLIVNDDLEVTLAVDAAGLHLGQEDMDPAEARAALGPDRIIGLSAGNAAEAARVDPAVVDYAGVGPAYVTGSKADAGDAIGLPGLSELRARLALPLVAIGGITAANAAEVMTTGVNGVAVVSAICAASDPEAAARALRRAVESGRQ